MDNRNFTRVDFFGEASIRYNDHIIIGNIENLSLQGLFIKTDQVLPLNLPVQVTVYTYANSSFNLHANVVRRDESGVGIQIDEMDVYSFVRLRNIVELKCNDQDVVMRETYKIVGCIH